MWEDYEEQWEDYDFDPRDFYGGGSRRKPSPSFWSSNGKFISSILTVVMTAGGGWFGVNKKFETSRTERDSYSRVMKLEEEIAFMRQEQRMLELEWKLVDAQRKNIQLKREKIQAAQDSLFQSERSVADESTP